MTKPAYRVRTVLLALVAASLLVTTSLALLVAWRGAEDSMNSLLRTTMARVRDNFRAKAGGYLNEATYVLDPIAQLARHGVFRGDAPDSITAVMRALMRHHAQFSAFTVVTEKGIVLQVHRMPDASLSSSLSVPAPGGRSTLWSHDSEAWRDVYPGGFEPAATAHDPRRTPWHEAALRTRELSWSPVHELPYGQGLGVTCAMPIIPGDPRGPIRYVAAIDIPLRDLAYFLGDQVGDGISAFVADDEGRLLLAPVARAEAAPRAGDSVVARMSPRDRDAWDAIRAGGDGGQEFFFLETPAGSYLGLRFSIRGETPWDWTIHVLADQELFMAEAVRQLRRSFLLVLLITAAAIGLAAVVAGRFTAPLTALATDMKRVERFELDGAPTVASRVREILEIHGAYERMKTGIRSFRKFVPEDLVRDLLECGQEARLGGERRALTVYFSDIADFSSEAERLSPEDLVEHLSRYFTRMSETIRAHDGTIDKYIGDAVMAFWGAPGALTNHAEPAARAALANMRSGGDAADSAGAPRFATRIGLNTGEVIVGNMGSPQRLNYTVIGDAVNLASRLEGLNKQYGTRIIVSEATRSALGAEFVTRKLDLVTVKGKERPVAIHELVETADRITADDRVFLERWDRALGLYESRDWSRALEAFTSCAEARDDLASRLYRDRCRRFLEEPPAADWDGVYRWKTK